MENGFHVNHEFMRFWDQTPVASNIYKNTSKHSWIIDFENYEDKVFDISQYKHYIRILPKAQGTREMSARVSHLVTRPSNVPN